MRAAVFFIFVIGIIYLTCLGHDLDVVRGWRGPLEEWRFDGQTFCG
jgi:hypothetical protein